MDPKNRWVKLLRSLSGCCQCKRMTSSFHSFLQAVLLCLLDLFPVLEKALHWKGDAARPTTHCDEVLQLMLTHMEPEHRILLRRTYARNLPAFVRRQVPGLQAWPTPAPALRCHVFSFVCRLGILTVRHMKRLERVILGYLEVYDGPEEEARLKILETLQLLMQYTWPRYSSQQMSVVSRADPDSLFGTHAGVHAVRSIKAMPCIWMLPVLHTYRSLNWENSIWKIKYTRYCFRFLFSFD